jgi:macrolide-specific efflux system membrane fusion protein
MKLPQLFRKRWFYFLLTLAVIFTSYYFWQARQAAENGRETHTVERRDLKQVVSASGTIDAKDQVTLKFQTTGHIIWVGVREGDRVEKWQAIASLDQRQLEKNLHKELNDYLKERTDFEQDQLINDPGVTSRNYLDIQTVNDEQLTLRDLLVKSQLDLNSTVIDVEVAEIARQYAHLYTPISGVVVKAVPEHGGVNTTTATEFIIADPSTLRFSAEIEELDIGLIEEGALAQITLDAFPNEPFDSRVESIDFTSTETLSGTTAYLVHFPIQNDPRFRLDLNGDIEVTIQEIPNALSVPIEAVLENDIGSYVTLKTAAGEEERPIQIGIETDEYYEVLGGLAEGDIIILP